MTKRILFIIIFISFLLVVLFSGYYSIKKIYNFLETKNWPSVKGNILNIQINKSIDQFEQIDIYFPVIEYQYRIDNNYYSSDSIYSENYPAGFPHKKMAITFLNHYQAGTKIEVFYNPQNFNQSFLVRQFNISNIFILLFSFFWFFILIFILTAFILHSFTMGMKTMK